jgi:hypothetical protein
MATASTLQYLESSDSAGTSYGVTPSNRRVVETFIASGAIAQGAWVSLDLGKSADGDKSLFVVEADTNEAGDPEAVIGVAIEGGAAAAGDRVQVQIAGLVDAKVDGSSPNIAIGDALFASTAAGVAVALTDATGGNVKGVIGTACEAASGATTVLCLITRKF